MKKTITGILIGCTALLGGCYFPETFDIKLDFKQDGGFHSRYDGTIVNMLALGDFVNKKATSKTDELLARDVPTLAKSPAVKFVSYIGKSRYKILTETDIPSGSSLNFWDAMMVKTLADKSISIYSAPVNTKMLNELKSAQLDFKGTIEVHLPPNAVVTESNGKPGSKFFGLMSDPSSYTWAIGGIQDRPLLKFHLK